MSQRPAKATHGETVVDDREIHKLGTNEVGRLRIFCRGFHGKWALAAVGGFIIGLFIGYSVNELPVAQQPEPPSMTQCMTDTLRLLDQKNPQTAETLHSALDHCYSLIQAQGLFSDLAIRKMNFFQQYRANGILMWMVVAVTFSGVLLAGLQLLASYQLAIANKVSLDGNNGEIVVKRDQIVLRSSITGFFILLISFCFFLVFVLYVYRFETIDENINSTLPPVPTLPMGGLGPPPSAQGKP